jgi:hypothetical protein
MSSKVRDVLLLVAVVALVVAALFPNGNGENPKDEDSTQPSALRESDSDPTETSTSRERIQPGAAKPATGVDHLFLPLVKGSEWIYRVEGPDDLNLAKTWSMKITRVPTDEEPGEIEMGFGKEMVAYGVWKEGASIRMDGLPFVEPLQFRGNRPTAVDGSFLPFSSAMIEGAVWKHIYMRNVVHESPDKHGKIHMQKAGGEQVDRAMAGNMEVVIVAAGRFDALRIDWLGRLDLRAGERTVLAGLTTEPFRFETTWMAKGIGIVRRRVSYPTPKEEKVITFDLIRYDRPSD